MSDQLDRERLKKERPIHQRLWDLVRQQRMELHDADLISDDEYTELAVDHPAVERLETYDALRAENKRLEGELAEARRDNGELRDYAIRTEKQRDEARKRCETLEAALREIRDHKVDEFDYPAEEWAKHTPETCEECKRWRDMKHPLQHSCDGWYRLFYGRENRNKYDAARTASHLLNQASQHYTMRKIARAALASEQEGKS